MKNIVLGAVGGSLLLVLGLSSVPWGFIEECGRVPARLDLLLSLPAGDIADVTSVPTVFSAFGYQQLEGHS